MSGRLSGPAAWLLYPITLAMMLFILAPLLVTIAISVSDSAYVEFPPHGFTLSWYGKVLADSDFIDSLIFSAGLAVAATSGALLLGMPAAFAVVRHEFPGRGAVRAARPGAPQRPMQPVGAVYELGTVTRHLVADDPVRKGQRSRAAHLYDAVPLHLHREAAGVRTIERTDTGVFQDGHDRLQSEIGHSVGAGGSGKEPMFS
jgi:hypothetical protein